MARRKRSRGRKRTRSRRSRRARAVVTVRSNPRRRFRRYRRRHNPRFSTKGLMNRVMQGAQDGIWIVGGKALTNAIPSLLGLSPVGALGLGVKALAAVGAGYVFDIVNANAGKLATAAGFASIYEPFIRGFNIPIISPALADYDYGAYPEYAAYPEIGEGVGAYPMGVGDDEDAYAAQY